MLDGIKVVIGDQVWDTLLGTGTVVEVTPENTMVARFGTRTMRYVDGGFVGTSGLRRLYWQDFTRLPRPLPGAVGLAEMQLVANYWTFVRTQRGVPERLPGITEVEDIADVE